MKDKYRYGHRPGRRRRTRVLIVVVISVLILGTVGGLIGYDLYKNRKTAPVESTGRTVIQALDDSVNKLTINESLYKLELPSDWKEVARKNDTSKNSVTWRATKKNGDNRTLELFVDKIPTTQAINRLVPVTTSGSKLNHGDVSDNCESFTKGGTANVSQAVKQPETLAKYQAIDFMCDLPQPTQNKVGTGSAEGINTVTVKGSMGAHKYFFLYTDHNIQPDYSIFYNIIKSFEAK